MFFVYNTSDFRKWFHGLIRSFVCWLICEVISFEDMNLRPKPESESPFESEPAFLRKLTHMQFSEF